MEADFKSQIGGKVMRDFSKKAFSVLLAGTLILGSVPSTALANSTFSKLQSPVVDLDISDSSDPQWQSSERREAHKQVMKERIEGKEARYKEGEALVLYYGNDKQLKNSRSIDLMESIIIDQIWNFELKVETNELSIKGLDSSDCNEIIMKVSSDTLSTEEIINQLQSNPNVITVEPNYVCKATDLGINDQYIDSQWSLENTGQNSGTVDKDINMDYIWNTGTKGTEKVIAVIDTGVNYNHEDLKNNMWTNDKPGILSGIHGFDFVNYDGDPLDDNGHGTHCSGVIAAEANEAGIVGVNQSAKIMALKFLDDYGSGYLSGAIDAYNYIYQAQTKLGVDVVAINNSWGGWGEDSEFTIMKKVMDKVGQEGALSICAAGNAAMDNDQDTIIFPSCVDSKYIIAVAASNEKDELATFSSYGKQTVDLAAPGTDILSSVIEDTFNPSIYTDKNSYCDYYNDSSSSNNFSDYILNKGVTRLTDTTGILEVDNGTFFGSDNGDSLCVNLPGMKTDEYYQLLVPYETYDSAKAIYDSAMIKADSTLGGVLFVDMYDVALDADGKPVDGPYIGGTYAFDMNSNYWDHLSGKVLDSSIAGESRAIVFEFYAYNSGDYKIYIDDIGVSKANLDTSAFGKYDFYNGTSMATPHVTGAVALATSYYENKNETISTLDLRDQIISSVRSSSSISDKVFSGGVLDLSKLNQPVPTIKGVAVNENRNIVLSGKFFGTTGQLKINDTEISTEQYCCEENEITIIDESLNQSLLNTKADFEFTTLFGTSKGSYYIIGATKTADEVGTFTDVYASGQITSDGTNLYFLDNMNNVYRYGKEEADSLIPLSPLLASDIFPDEELDESNNKQLTIETTLEFTDGKIWTVVSNSTYYSKDYALISYSIAEDIWVKEAELPGEIINRNNYFSLAAYDGMLYCIGGLDMTNHTASKEVQMFNPDTRQWSQKPKLPEGRFLSIGKQVGDKLIVTLGGNDAGDCPKNLVFDGASWKEQTAILDPVTNQALYLPNVSGITPSYKEFKYYSAQIGVEKGGLIYVNLPGNGVGVIYTYDLALDKYCPTDYKLADDIPTTSDILATSVGGLLYAMYTVETDGVYSVKLLSIPIESVLVYVSSITLSGNATELEPGKTMELIASIAPENAENKNISWISSDSSFASVDETGNVTALEAGVGKTVTITAIANDGSGVKAEYIVTIVKKVTAITIKAKSNKLKVGESMDLKAIITPTNATNQEVSWTSSNTEYAVVNEEGTVTAKKSGKGKTVTITATANDGSGVKATYKIKIKK